MNVFKNYLECKNNKSSKFYEIEVTHNAIITKHGRIGGSEIVFIYSFDDEKEDLTEKIFNFYEKILKSKIKKGYKEVCKKDVLLQLKLEFEDYFYYNQDLFSFAEFNEFQSLEW